MNYRTRKRWHAFCDLLAQLADLAFAFIMLASIVIAAALLLVILLGLFGVGPMGGWSHPSEYR